MARCSRSTRTFSHDKSTLQPGERRGVSPTCLRVLQDAVLDCLPRLLTRPREHVGLTPRRSPTHSQAFVFWHAGCLRVSLTLFTRSHNVTLGPKLKPDLRSEKMLAQLASAETSVIAFAAVPCGNTSRNASTNWRPSCMNTPAARFSWSPPSSTERQITLWPGRLLKSNGNVQPFG